MRDLMPRARAAAPGLDDGRMGVAFEGSSEPAESLQLLELVH